MWLNKCLNLVLLVKKVAIHSGQRHLSVGAIFLASTSKDCACALHAGRKVESRWRLAKQPRLEHWTLTPTDTWKLTLN